MNPSTRQAGWMTKLARDIERSLATKGIACHATIEWDATLPVWTQVAGFVAGAHEVVAVSVVCRIEAADEVAFRELYTEAFILNLQSALDDRLPPDWRCRVVYVRPGKSSELDPPQFGKARVGRLEMLKGAVMKLRDKQPKAHPLVKVFVNDVYRTIGSHVSSEVWDSVRRSLEESWRDRLRYRVEPDALITAEDYELLWTCVNYLLDKFGLPSPDLRDRNGGGFSTRSSNS